MAKASALAEIQKLQEQIDAKRDAALAEMEPLLNEALGRVKDIRERMRKLGIRRTRTRKPCATCGSTTHTTRGHKRASAA